MAYKISDDCIACGTCAGVCPVSAISEGDGKYVIDLPGLRHLRRRMPGFRYFRGLISREKQSKATKRRAPCVPALLFPYSGDFGLCIREGPEFLI